MNLVKPLNFRIMSKLISSIFFLLFAACTIYGQSNEIDYKNSINTLPLPGLVIAEYERMFGPYSNDNLWSAGILLGTSYDAGKFQVGKGMKDLFDKPVSFELTGDHAINPFIRYYYGNPEKKIRSAAEVRASLIIITIENSDTHFFPAYEVHQIWVYSFTKRLFATWGIGFKHFLVQKEINFEDESTLVPAFRFQADNLDEKPKQWLPSAIINIGYRF